MPISERVISGVRRPVIAVLVLLLVYVALSLFADPGGSLGTDTGAKVATLEHMVDTGSWRPDVGYWAEDWDAGGDYHPLLDTHRTADGEWVNVTTLPMLVASRPLYAVGGYRLALALPMMGAVLAALACRDLARSLADDDAGERAFWVVGLASPMVVYALDFWEHSLGAGLMVAAVAALVHVTIGDRRPVIPLLAGVAFGVSASMRTETFVVAFAAVGCTSLWLLWRRLPRAAVVTGLAAILGFAGPWFANAALDDALGGLARSQRLSSTASSTASSASSGAGLLSGLSARAWEAFLTWFGLPGLERTASIVGGMLVAGLFGVAVLLARRGDDRRAKVAAAFGVAVFASTLIGAGPAFVRGALMASPIALLGFWTTREDRAARLVLAIAVLATILTWNFQYLGGAGPQWGGRYILAPTLLLTTLGVVRIRTAPALVVRALVVLAVVVSAFGVTWLSVRSHRVDAFFDDLSDRPEDVIISTNGFLVREGGAASDDRRYLSIGRAGDLDGAVAVVDAAGLRTFAVLAPTPTLPSVAARPLGVEQVEFIDAPFWYHRFTIED